MVVGLSALREGTIEQARVSRDRSIRGELMQRRRSRPLGCLVAAAAMVLKTSTPVLPPGRVVLMKPLLAVAADAVIKASD